ncbi:MAG: radical SAM family heme chaperone HemW [Leptolyngbyaceae cyanobacterium bins.59]|nr:radical SAM family heme chaperone HemW [Leptolyngbyaceae cyanobacterium bins.59]
MMGTKLSISGIYGPIISLTLQPVALRKSEPSILYQLHPFTPPYPDGISSLCFMTGFGNINVLRENHLATEGLNFIAPRSAYLHIPFCRRRCYYCDFPVSVVGDRARGETSPTIAQYLEILIQEIATTPNRGASLETVFFGGGTPSLLAPIQLDRLLQALDRQFGINATAEISIEMDPGTFDRAQLQGYLAAGVTRISLGVQAFQSELLALCGRTHTVQDVYEAIDLLHGANVQNFSLDLISGLPHQTLDHWQASLESAIATHPAHLSAYDLVLEPVTAFGRRYEPGTGPLPTDTTAAEMYRMAQSLLTGAGYDHYEVSNYGRSGYQCRHNRVYWENRPFYGFGMGAASYIDGVRLTRPRKRSEYTGWVANLTSGDSAHQTEVESQTDRLLDTLMLGLRLAEGVTVDRLLQEFGAKAVQQVIQGLQSHAEQGWVMVPERKDSLPSGSIRLTDPEGFLFSNTILSDLFAALDD